MGHRGGPDISENKNSCCPWWESDHDHRLFSRSLVTAPTDLHRLPLSWNVTASCLLCPEAILIKKFCFVSSLSESPWRWTLEDPPKRRHISAIYITIHPKPQDFNIQPRDNLKFLFLFPHLFHRQPSIIRVMKSRLTRGVGHVTRMRRKRNTSRY